ncbi:hypothetical protein [Streptomyces sp. NPDC001492]
MWPRPRSGPDRIRAVLVDWENAEVELYDGVRLVTARRLRRTPTDGD